MKTLYKTDSKKKLRTWTATATAGSITTTAGLATGKKVVKTTKCKPKNVGRGNETSAEEQAEKECRALYTKKLTRDGYRETEDPITASLTTMPTLARDYSKLSHQLKAEEFLLASPKLDGVRAIWDPSLKKFQSRKGTYYNIPALEALMTLTSYRVDGEIYAHNTPLNRIVAEARKPRNRVELEFRAFDIVDTTPRFLRLGVLEAYISEIDSPLISIVPETLIPQTEVETIHDKFVTQGYEGVMLRRVTDTPYEQGVRSENLYKFKKFEEAEFTVIGVNTDKTGQGVLVCETESGETFDCRCRGTDAQRLHQAEHPENYIGGLLTVRFFTTTEYGKPQFPIGVTMRYDT